jgi:hypothetical protein
MILLNLYERQSAERMRGSGQYNQAVVRGDVLYKFNKFSGSITATTRSGLMVDGDGQIWVAVRYKNNPERVKQAWYIGDSRDLPPLPKNPSAKQVKQWNELARKRFGPAFAKLPDCASATPTASRKRSSTPITGSRSHPSSDSNAPRQSHPRGSDTRSARYYQYRCIPKVITYTTVRQPPDARSRRASGGAVRPSAYLYA